ncbi:MAG: hypothetical protein GC199_08950 [Alphaproteobacteria bacterium]|nr:hypothetical protein [Alphaproteobacteria bacterium]
MPMMDRRSVLRAMAGLAGTFVVTARAHAQTNATSPLQGPAAAEGSLADRGTFRFPQGVASADPLPDQIILWTRVESTAGETGAVSVTVEMAPDESFAEIVLTRTVAVTQASDHTLRIIARGLNPDTFYFYRFRAGADVSRTGRTRTAPAPEADRAVRFAFASCQNYEQGFYGAWARMVADDTARPAGEQLDFVLFLGDFIYEVRGDRHGIDMRTDPQWLRGADGAARGIPPFPDGSAEWPATAYNTYPGAKNAVSLADYRHLYKLYLTDPHLQDARARWPFVSTWDDHEFTNDAWQSFDTYFNDGNGAQRRKVAANQAWFEFIPALLTGAGPARDFSPASVKDQAPPEGAPPRDPDTAAALATMRIYRAFRFGRHCELVLTDLRSYRSAPVYTRALKEKLGPLAPVDVVRALDAGRNAFGEPPGPASFEGQLGPVANPRADADPGTHLGDEQREWFLATLKSSTATWKIWGNSTPALPMRLDLSSIWFSQMKDVVLGTDGWQGYPGELRALMTELRMAGVTNLVSCAGDYHLHAAGTLPLDPQAPWTGTAAVEIACAGISSEPQFALVEPATQGSSAFRAMALIERDDARVVNWNRTVTAGAFSGLVMGFTDWEWLADLFRTNPNPWIAFFDAAANGYGLVTLAADRVEASLVATAPATQDYGPDGAPRIYEARFRIEPWGPGEDPRLERLPIQGAAPFPIS